jgi:hypothetical protein
MQLDQDVAQQYWKPPRPPSPYLHSHLPSSQLFVKRPRGELNTTFRPYLDTQLPTAPISIFFVRLKADAGQTGVWDEEDLWGGGIKPGLADSVRAIPRETRSEMKERPGAVGTSTTRRNRTLRYSWDRHYLPRWRHHILERQYPARIPSPSQHRYHHLPSQSVINQPF